MKRLFLTLLGLCLMPSCSLLNPVEDDPVRHLLDSPFSSRTPTASKPAVAVARPSLPPYLERVELITRTADGRLEVHENDLWAEPLDAGITRVIADNLRRLTGSTNIQPSANFITKEYDSLLEIRIERFDPQPDGNLLLECTWKLQPIVGGDATPKAFRTTVAIRQDLEGGEMSGRIVAMNDALGQLAKKIRGGL
ncbi:membrane integrity-associated transporter subunit PqiC [Luteolibacter sp. AS25]|uniref:PqiC family protein n=1 Tax=Luteolibacter sp. AS25 TaxID=3135776 RepID=UPI00398AE49E